MIFWFLRDVCWSHVAHNLWHVTHMWHTRDRHVTNHVTRSPLQLLALVDANLDASGPTTRAAITTRAVFAKRAAFARSLTLSNCIRGTQSNCERIEYKITVITVSFKLTSAVIGLCGLCWNQHYTINIFFILRQKSPNSMDMFTKAADQ